MRVSKRIAELAKIVPKCSKAADIGCDHGYLSLLLLKSEKCDKVIACDVKEKPLNKAIKLLKENGLADRAEFYVCDGLSKANDADVVIIAGIGAKTIRDILTKGSDAKADYFILQPSSGVSEVREYLSLNGYVIVDEYIIEDRHFYPVIVAKKGVSEPLSQIEKELGPINVKKSEPEVFRYANWRLKVYQKAVQTSAVSEKGRKNQKLIKEKIDLLKRYLEANGIETI